MKLKFFIFRFSLCIDSAYLN